MTTRLALTMVALLLLPLTTPAQNIQPIEIDLPTVQQSAEEGLQALAPGRIIANLQMRSAGPPPVAQSQGDRCQLLEPLRLAANIPVTSVSGIGDIPTYTLAKGQVFTYGTDTCVAVRTESASADIDIFGGDQRFSQIGDQVFVDAARVITMVRDGTLTPLTAAQAEDPSRVILLQLGIIVETDEAESAEPTLALSN